MPTYTGQRKLEIVSRDDDYMVQVPTGKIIDGVRIKKREYAKELAERGW